MKRLVISTLIMIMATVVVAQMPTQKKRINKDKLKLTSITVYYEVGAHFVQRMPPDAIVEKPESQAQYVMHITHDKYGFAPVESLSKSTLNVIGDNAVFIANNERFSCHRDALEFVLVREPLKPTHWEIHKEMAEINGYQCIKATAGDTVAWFCPKVDVPFGPIGTMGLKGLIVELRTSKLIYRATNVSKQADMMHIRLPMNLPIYTRKQYDEQRKNGRKLLKRKRNNDLRLDDAQLPMHDLEPRHGDVMPKHH